MPSAERVCPLHEFHFPLMRRCVDRGEEGLAQLLANAWMITIEDGEEFEEVVITYLDQQRHLRDALIKAPMIKALRICIESLLARQIGVRILI